MITKTYKMVTEHFITNNIKIIKAIKIERITKTNYKIINKKNMKTELTLKKSIKYKLHVKFLLDKIKKN